MARNYTRNEPTGAGQRTLLVEAHRVHLNREGYTSQGHYYGVGQKVFSFTVYELQEPSEPSEPSEPPPSLQDWKRMKVILSETERASTFEALKVKIRARFPDRRVIFDKL